MQANPLVLAMFSGQNPGMKFWFVAMGMTAFVLFCIYTTYTSKNPVTPSSAKNTGGSSSSSLLSQQTSSASSSDASLTGMISIVDEKVGIPFTLTFPNGLAVGYSWHAIYDKKSMTLLRSINLPPDANTGAGARESFTLRPKKKGYSTLNFLYYSVKKPAPMEIRRYAVHAQ